MITKNTVFILGAGASQPYGFPSGQELVDKICQALGPSKISLRNGEVSTKSGFVRKVASASGCTLEHVKEFREALYRSNISSIDEFLEPRPEFLAIGKMAIARALIACECEETLFKKRNDDWYKYFFNQLNTNFDDFDKNKVSFITFNYDRSLEHLLYTSLKYAYGKTDEEVFEKMRNLEIIHLYGQLGKYFPCKRKNKHRSYKRKKIPACAEIIIAGEGIKIISDNVEGDPEFDAAHRLIAAAEYVCFLGFGYNLTNLERLGLKHLNPLRRNDVFGSVFGFTDAEVGRIQNLMATNFSVNFQNISPSYDCLGFLRNNRLLMNIYS